MFAFASVKSGLVPTDVVKNVFLGFVAFCEVLSVCFVCDSHVCATIMMHLLSSATVCLPSLALFLACFLSALSLILCVTCPLFLSIENSVLGSVYISVPSRSQLYGFLPVSANACFSCTP